MKPVAPCAPGAQGDLRDDYTLWKHYRRVFFYCVGMTSAILMYGYDYVVVGTVSAMPGFQRDFGAEIDGRWLLPSLWLGLWNFASPGCGMIGALIGGAFQDRFGRRMSLGVGALVCAAGVAVCFVSNLPTEINTRRGVFLAGKGVQGGAIGMVMATAQTYMSEIAPTKLRGPLLAFFPIFTIVGQLLGAAVIFACMNIRTGYTIAFATQWFFSAFPLAMACIIPESPTYLIRKNQFEKAHKAQSRLDRAGMDTEKTLLIIRQNIEHESQGAKATYLESFRKDNLRRTLIVVFANVLPQIFGLTLLSKSSYFLQVVGMAANMSIMLLIVGLVCSLIANVASFFIMSRFERRPLILYTLTGLVVIWTGMGIAGCFSGPVTVWYTGVSLILVAMTAGVGVWPASHVVGAETSALHLRAKAQGIGFFTASAAAAIFNFIMPYIFNPDQGNLRAKTGFVYAGLCIVGFVLAFFFVPEMKGRTAAEIDHMFELGLPAREFKHWQGEVELGHDAEKTPTNSDVTSV